MNLFIAALYTNGYMPGQTRYEKLTDIEKDICAKTPHILESYHYVLKQKYVDDMRRDNATVFLDSGAFSAWTLGATINIEDYCAYIIRNRDIIRHEDGVMMASVLDGIGDPLQTWRNQLEMEQRGAKPLPCFHFGEDEKYLEWYIQNYEYITIGGMVGKSSQKLRIWLDRIWDRYLVDGSGNAKIKVHGFGLTSVPLMADYPWYSCDSSSWIQAAAFGSAVHPKHGPLRVSEKSPSRHDAGQHLCNLTPIEQDFLFKELEDMGFTYERLSTVYESRVAYNIWGYCTINHMINASHDQEFKARAQELF